MYLCTRYGISTVVSADRTALHIAFTRNVYTNQSLRVMSVSIHTIAIVDAIVLNLYRFRVLARRMT